MKMMMMIINNNNNNIYNYITMKIIEIIIKIWFVSIRLLHLLTSTSCIHYKMKQAKSNLWNWSHNSNYTLKLVLAVNKHPSFVILCTSGSHIWLMLKIELSCLLHWGPDIARHSMRPVNQPANKFERLIAC